jgi:hypothetical protein
VKGEHLSSGEMAAYIDGRLSSEEEAEVQNHLAQCPTCRKEGTEVADLLEGRRKKRRVIILPVGLAAAAAILLLFGPVARERGEDLGEALRGPGEAAVREGGPSIEMLEPAQGGELAADSIRFSWRAIAPEALYRVHLTDETGIVVWEEDTHDTSIPLPGDVELRPGGSYLWYLDALLNAQSWTSAVRSFRILRE